MSYLNDQDSLASSLKRRPKFQKAKRTWRAKFRDSFTGFRQSLREQSSYRVHFGVAIMTIIAATFFHFDLIRWTILILAIFAVVTTEMLNSAIELLSREVTDEQSEFVAQSLNIASGAVLMISIGAVLVGLILFGDAICKFF